MRKIYIDLDSLFDTRLGLISQLDEEAASAVVTNPAYWERDYTDWGVLTGGRIDNATFAKHWAERDNRTLKASIVSGIINILMRIMAEYEENVKSQMVSDPLSLEINVHPYDLSSDELEEMEAILHRVFYADLPITFCSAALEELTPKYLGDHYSAVVLYDFQPWIKHHCHTIAKNRLPDLNIIVPKAFEHDPSKLSIEQKQEEFIAFKLWMVEFLAFEFVDLAWFSMFRPEKPVVA